MLRGGLEALVVVLEGTEGVVAALEARAAREARPGDAAAARQARLGVDVGRRLVEDEAGVLEHAVEGLISAAAPCWEPPVGAVGGPAAPESGLAAEPGVQEAEVDGDALPGGRARGEQEAVLVARALCPVGV